MNSAPTAALVLLLMPATDAAPLDDAAERYRPHMVEGVGQASTGWSNADGGFHAVEAKLFDANRAGSLRPSPKAAAR
jgi:hypothetical protein